MATNSGTRTQDKQGMKEQLPDDVFHSSPLFELCLSLRLLLGDLVEYRIDYFIDLFLYLINLVNNAISERND